MILCPYCKEYDIELGEHMKLLLFDPLTEKQIEYPIKEGETIDWNLKQAVTDLVNKIARETDKSPQAIMFNNEPFHIRLELDE